MRSNDSNEIEGAFASNFGKELDSQLNEPFIVIEYMEVCEL